MKKFFNSQTCVMWASIGMISAASVVAFYLALKDNANPTGDQLLGGLFFIVFFSILALVSIGASIEEYIKKDKK